MKAKSLQKPHQKSDILSNRKLFDPFRFLSITIVRKPVQRGVARVFPRLEALFYSKRMELIIGLYLEEGDEVVDEVPDDVDGAELLLED